MVISTRSLKEFTIQRCYVRSLAIVVGFLDNIERSPVDRERQCSAAKLGNVTEPRDSSHLPTTHSLASPPLPSIHPSVKGGVKSQKRPGLCLPARVVCPIKRRTQNAQECDPYEIQSAQVLRSESRRRDWRKPVAPGSICLIASSDAQLP